MIICIIFGYILCIFIFNLAEEANMGEIKLQFAKTKQGFGKVFTNKVSHDLSEIIIIYWFAAQETFLIISNVENT